MEEGAWTAVFGENLTETIFARVHIARTIERICPDAILLNYTNPMHKVCDAITTLSKTLMRRAMSRSKGEWEVGA